MGVTTPTVRSFLQTPISYIPLSKLPKPPTTSFSTVQSLRRNPHLAAVGTVASFNSHIQDTGGLGHTVFSALEPDPSTDPNTTKKAQRAEKPDEEKEISGSDILRALQKASAKKANTKKQRKKKGWSTELKRNPNNNGKKVVDFDKVRPITIKSDWATRLTDLENRLQEFSAL